MRRTRPGGGWSSLLYSFQKARSVGGLLRFYKALRSKNACKTCALGMGGQRGGMVNEAGHFPEVCKKSMQAMAADMQGRIPRTFFEQRDLAQLCQMTPRQLEHAGRLTEPLYAGPKDDRYRPISWDDALDRCATRLRSTSPDENFFYFSGRSSNEAGFLLQLFARLYGTNHVNNCSYYCHQASGVGLSSVFGSGTATLQLEDLDRCDTVFLIGGNPASNHPRLMSVLMRLRRRGGKVIVINPLREPGLVEFRVPSDLRSLLFGTRIATEYVKPTIGGDIALLTGIARHVVELGAHDARFLAEHTDESEPVLADLARQDWSEIERASGVSRETAQRIAEIYAESRATVFAWTMGITHHAHGSNNVRAICNLALLRGMVGKPGAGMLPIRGHSNVQGIGSVGVTPKLKDAVLERLESHFGVRVPETPGLDTLGCMDAMRAGKMRNAWCLGGNLFGSNPDATAARDAFEKLDFACYLSTTLNTGHAWGRAAETLILPVLARDEEPHATTQESMFNFVRLSEGGPARHDGPRSEIEVIAALGKRIFDGQCPIDWAQMEQTPAIREAIAKIIPGYEAIGEIDATRTEFQIDGRTFHAPTFPTETGRARMFVVPIPKMERTANELWLMTIRSEGQFNTVVYEEEDLYRGQDRRDVILMNARDMAERELREDELVTVSSATGSMTEIRVREFDIAVGCAAMYYPEANVLVPRNADRESRTPVFKSIAVQVAKAGRVPLGVV